MGAFAIALSDAPDAMLLAAVAAAAADAGLPLLAADALTHAATCPASASSTPAPSPSLAITSDPPSASPTEPWPCLSCVLAAAAAASLRLGDAVRCRRVVQAAATLPLGACPARPRLATLLVACGAMAGADHEWLLAHADSVGVSIPLSSLMP